MSEIITIDGLVEGLLDEYVLAHLIRLNPLLQLGTVRGKRGRPYIEANIGKYNAAAQFSTPGLCLFDLDHDPCPIELINAWLPHGRSPHFLVRIAVREVESWFLADPKHLAEFLKVSLSKIPHNPDHITDPKQAIVSLAAKSTSRQIRESVAPTAGSSAKVGAAYISEMARFIQKYWDVDTAIQNSQSLARAVKAIKHFPAPT